MPVSASRRLWLDANKEKIREQYRAWEDKNKDRRLIMRRKSRLSREFGITPEQWDEMFAAQGGRCAACHEPLSGGKHTHTDHCHRTGKVRGILCRACNLTAGYLECERRSVVEAYLNQFTGQDM